MFSVRTPSPPPRRSADLGKCSLLLCVHVTRSLTGQACENFKARGSSSSSRRNNKADAPRPAQQRVAACRREGDGGASHLLAQQGVSGRVWWVGRPATRLILKSPLNTYTHVVIFFFGEKKAFSGSLKTRQGTKRSIIPPQVAGQ
jgi:hypothetical protein